MASKIFAALGISDFKEYMFKYFLPIFLFNFIFLFIFLFAFSSLYTKLFGIFVFFMIFIALFSYPIIIIDNQTKNIEETSHFFITYAGALSTINLDRKSFFADLSAKIRYREISKIFKKLIYLVENIKIDFSTAAYKIASLIKTEHFARFLERMGISMSFNSSISKFFLDEQKALMDGFEVVYREGLERIKMIEEMFVSLVLSFAFLLSIILLIPFLIGINANVMLEFGILGIIILDAFMFVFTKYFIPTDKLYHNLGYESERKKVIAVFIFSIFLSIIIFPFIFFSSLSIMLKIAIIGTPFLLTGMYSNYQERLVWKRDVLFPAFIRSLGDVHQAKGGTLTTTIETLIPHNFGILNLMLERVYKRLKITQDKFSSWFYFSKESGSALIAEFTDIFISVVYRGGSAQIAGEIVSNNMERINGLRDQKREYTSTFRGNAYGSFIGLGLTIYISLVVSVLLYRIFTSMTANISGTAKNIIGGIFPISTKIDFTTSSVYVAAILTIHAFISAFIVKEADGGNKFSMFSDFVIMLWIGAALEIMVILMMNGLFKSYFS